MMPTWMDFDVLESFDKCMTDLDSDSVSLIAVQGSLTGSDFNSVKRSDIMDGFSHTITGNSLRMVYG